MTLTARIAVLTFAALLFMRTGDVRAQDQGYTVAVRGINLDEAIQRFVEATGTAVSYDPALVRGRSASCAAEDAPAESVLRCILADSGLDFVRLSSGTYVLTERVQVAPERGYLAGRVTDRDTGTPLSDSHVQLASLMAVTDQSGRFTFPALVPGRYVLTISHVGYRPWRDTMFVAAREQIRAQVEMESEPVFITPVIVDGLQQRRPSAALGRPTASADRIGAMDPAPQNRIRALAGVRLNDVTADVHVQGSDAGASQLRLDGVPVFLPRSMAGLVGPFGSFALERITVHKAGFGAPHGSQTAGVVLAEHALSSTNDVDVQADPYSLNTRIRLSSPTGDGVQVHGMAAARVGLWDIVTPPQLQSTLEDWSRPDPFLIMAPLESETFIDPANLLGAPVNPRIRFSDIHAAARIRFSPLRSVHASIYQGRHRLGGGVLNRAERFADSLIDFTVEDEYAWRNRTGQIRYDAVLGSRTLAGIQLRASSYRLDHDYQVLDSVAVVFQDQSARLGSISTTPVRDGNGVLTLAAEATLDYAIGPHHLTAGLESGFIDSRFDLQSVYFVNEQTNTPIADAGSGAFDKSRVSSNAESWYAAAYAEDRLRLSTHLHLEGGVRLTYLDARRTVYAEPRTALLYDGELGALGTMSSRTSAGLYRQFLNQTDAGKLNAGALLPTVRVWLPVDATVRPPMAYHLAQEFLFSPRQNWTIRLEGYYRWDANGLALAYAPFNEAGFIRGPAFQSQFLASTRGWSYGGNLGLAWTQSAFRLEGRYAYGHAVRESDLLFEGRRHTAPWIEPHRLELSADWMPANRLAFSARWKGVWGRTWGFRQLYYDYFGNHGSTRFHGPFDLGDPDSHVLSALSQLDVSVSYSQRMGSAQLQLRAEVINVLDHENVIDWRLVPGDGTWIKEPRTLYPMMPAVAVRLSL